MNACLMNCLDTVSMCKRGRHVCAGAIPPPPAGAGTTQGVPRYPRPTISPIAGQFASGRVSPAPGVFGNLNVSVNFGQSMPSTTAAPAGIGLPPAAVAGGPVYNAYAASLHHYTSPPSPLSRWASSNMCCHACGAPSPLVQPQYVCVYSTH
jgi:hypothetical protein